MKRIKKIALTLFMLCSFIATFAQRGEQNHVITGNVVDEQGNALPEASVYVLGTTAGIATNAKGEFALRIKEGKYTLRISFTGYSTQEHDIDVPQNTTLKYQLQPMNNHLEEVVITGTRTEKLLKDSPVLTRVISNDQIIKLNPVNLQSVLEYELPGIQFGRHHGTGLTTMTFQGMEGNYVLFLVDGERIGGEGAADNIDFDRFNVDDIERVEIIKGAMSTLYGSNALGGVINIITKKANRPFMGNLSAQYSKNGTRKYSASAGSKMNRFSTLTSVSYREKEAFLIEDTEGTSTIYEDPSGTQVVITAPGTTSVLGHEIWQFNQKFTYAFTDKFSAELSGGHYTNRTIEVDKTAKTQDLFHDYTISSKLNYIFNTDHRIDFVYYMDDFIKYTDYLVANRDKNKVFDNINHVFRFNYSGNITENSTLTVGTEYNIESLKHYMFNDTTTHRVNDFVVYAQEERKIGERLSLVTGIRADVHSRYGLHVTPRVSAMYKINDFAFRGGYASGFRSPSLKELYSEWNHQGMFYVVGNLDLRPETSHQVSLSAEYTKGILNASVSAYYNKFNDKIAMSGAQNDVANRYEMMYINADEAQTTGLDVTAQLRFKKGFSLRGSYAYVNDHEEIEGYNTSSIRPHSITLNATYSFNINKVKASISLYERWMSSVDAWSRRASDGVFYYTTYRARDICSIKASAQFPRGVRVNVGVENILNFKDKNLSSDTSISPQRGVSFECSISINIADMFKL